MYQADERSLAQVWQRLGLENEQPISMERQPQMLETTSTQQPASAKILDLERNRPMRQTRKPPLARVFSLISAACIAVLIVSGMLIISNLARQGRNTHISTAPTTATPQQQASLPPGIYTTNGALVLRLDGQTHQALWQQKLEEAAKIVPSGNVVYVLQSSQSYCKASSCLNASQTLGDTNAVVALDANSGKILWTHAFTVPAQKKNVVQAQTTDLVLAQNQLYVGWQMWIGSTNMIGRIYVLNASDGSQQAVYSNDSVWSLVVDDGVIAASGNYSLQVYDAASGKPLWHVTYTSGTSEPVRGLSIVNNQVYATISTNNETAGEGEDYVAAYDINSGKRTWQSPVFPGSSLDSYLAVDQSYVYAYDVQSNKQLWRKSINGGGQSPLIVNSGMLYTVADNGSDLRAHLVALATATGATKWQHTLTGNFLNGLALSNGVIYASTFSDPQTSAPDPIDAFNASSGQTLWEDTEHGTYGIVPTA